MSGKRFFVSALLTLFVVAILVVGGVAIYNAGFTHGAMTNITLPEGSEFPMMPSAYRPMGWHYGSRVGLLGLFPLLCFGGFFFLMLMFGFGAMSRRRAWMHHYGLGSHPNYWKHHSPPPWGPTSKPPWAEDQSQTEPNTSSAETEETKK